MNGSKSTKIHAVTDEKGDALKVSIEEIGPSKVTVGNQSE